MHQNHIVPPLMCLFVVFKSHTQVAVGHGLQATTVAHFNKVKCIFVLVVIYTASLSAVLWE